MAVQCTKHCFEKEKSLKVAKIEWIKADYIYMYVLRYCRGKVDKIINFNLKSRQVVKF